MSRGKRRYLCAGCRRQTKILDRDAPDSIRTGCESCGAIMRFVAYGSVAFSLLTDRRETYA